ncbi:MAG TPA: PAS domain S-box protein [Burkholderiales bacterium]|jgi:PAS domain S-box-containing protein
MSTEHPNPEGLPPGTADVAHAPAGPGAGARAPGATQGVGTHTTATHGIGAHTAGSDPHPLRGPFPGAASDALPGIGGDAPPSAQDRVARLTRLYAALSRSNEAIFRESDQLRLCRAVCEIAVTEGALVSASIRMYDPSGQNLDLICGYGPLFGWVGARSFPRNHPLSRAAWSAREQKRLIINDYIANPATPESRDDAQRTGVRAAGNFPLSIDGHAAGVLCVYAGQKDYFDEELAGLLDEIARNLSFAFSKLRADAALTRAAAQYRALFDSMPMAVRVICEERVVIVNPAALALYGVDSPGELLGRDALAGVAVSDRPLARARMQEVMRTRAPLPPSQQFILRPDGVEVPVEVTTMPFEYVGKPAMVSVMRDRTEERAANERIARLTRLNNALTRANEAIFRIGDVALLCQQICEIAVKDGGLVSAAIRAYNPVTGMLQPFCGFGPLRGRLGADVIALEDAKSNAAKVARTRTRYVVNDLALDVNATARVEDASAIGVRASAGFALAIGDDLAGVLSVFAGSTGYFDEELVLVLQEMANNLSFAFSKIRAETELTRSQQHYRMLFDATPQAYRVICEGRMVMINPAGARLLGFDSPAEAIGRASLDAVAPERHAASIARNQRVLREGRPQPPEETTLVRADGSTVDVEVMSLPFEFEGKPAVFSIALDLTARKEAQRAAQRYAAELEEQVARRTVELKQANADLETFSYTVAHDLRAPLRRMTGFTGLLLESLGPSLDGENRMFLDRISDGAAAMGRLIEGLLALAHLGRAELKPQEIDLSAEARAIAASLAARDPARTVTFAIADNAGGYADPRLIHTVLENLMGNAWKFTTQAEHASIEFGECLGPAGKSAPCATDPGGEGGGDPVESSAGQRVYFVRDNGAGFDMRYAKKLFGTFQRLHAANEFPGTGIGLASVKRIITHHGGRVWAEGEVGKGATFYFSLPNAPR